MIKKGEYDVNRAMKWDLCHEIINKARELGGLPLINNTNPYKYIKGE